MVDALAALRKSHPMYDKVLRWEAARGIRRYVDPGPARRHIERLKAGGASYAGIGKSCGLPARTISNIATGVHSRIQRRVSDAVLSLTLGEAIAGTGMRPGVGVIRRVEALLTLGHRHEEISAYGFDSAAMTRRRPEQVHVGIAVAARAAYEGLRDSPGASRHTAVMALNSGYQPPGAWDEDTIDDPAALPYGGTDPDGFAVVDAAMLARLDYTAAAAAERLGVTKDGMMKRLKREGRGDIVKRLSINADRVPPAWARDAAPVPSPYA